MGVMCYILLKKTKDDIYRAGQSVQGTVKYILDKPTKFDSIKLLLIGKGKCHWTESDEESSSSYSNKQQYLSICENLLKTTRGERLMEGNYEYPFDLKLPLDIPSSFKDKTCTISYKIVVNFRKANFFGTLKKFDKDIIIYGNLSPCSPEPLMFGLKKDVAFSINKYVEIKAEIERTHITPGENIKLILFINNATNINIKVRTEIIKHFTYISKQKYKMVDKGPIKTTTHYSPRLQMMSNSRLICIIPTLPSLVSIQHTKILIGEYKLRITAELPFPNKNKSVEIPIVIGDRGEQDAVEV